MSRVTEHQLRVLQSLKDLHVAKFCNSTLQWRLPEISTNLDIRIYDIYRVCLLTEQNDSSFAKKDPALVALG